MEERQPALTSDAAQAAPFRRAKTVLIVDDSEPTARALASLLGTANFRPVVFHRASSALEWCRANACVAAVVDIHLPDINGVILAQQLRTIYGPLTPIVILSGDTSMPTLNSLSKANPTHFFSKPVNASHLLERLQEWIDGASAPRPASVDGMP